MEFIAHRVNTIAELKKTPNQYGVEIDLRDGLDGRVYMAHDPFTPGEDFEAYLEHYGHGTMILNIKSERIEFKVLELMENYQIPNYFFLDSSFPMIHLLANEGIRNMALRYSEFEGMDTLTQMQGRANWIWVDCFTQLPMNQKQFANFKAMGYNLCLVSPELQGREEEIESYKSYLASENIIFDAICTKQHNISRWE